MVPKRNRTKQVRSLQERLLISAKQIRERARRLPHGKEREMLLRRAKQDEVASDLADWLAPSIVSKRQA